MLGDQAKLRDHALNLAKLGDQAKLRNQAKRLCIHLTSFFIHM
jgi:hypothetical protein